MNRGLLMSICGAALVLGLVLAGAVVSGCASGEGKDGQMEGLTWILQSYRGADGETQAVPADVRVDAVFAAGKVGGSSGCNSYQGPARISGSRMENGPLTTTKKMCLPSVMEIEQAYLANLESAATAVVEDESGSLVIQDADGDAILTFAKEKPREFSGSSWKLASCSNGTGGVVSVLENTYVNITFDENGNLAGLAGCNSYWGTYTTEGDKLSIGSVGSTELSCAEPAGIMEQEEAYLKALQDAATFKIKGDTLELRSGDGSLLASYDAWKVPPGG
jgi:heat shock protein HslJ